MRWIVALCLIFTIASCSGPVAQTNAQTNAQNSLQQEASISLELDRQFQLKQGQAANFSPENVSESWQIDWIEIKDSRCPSGSECVWEGQVEVGVRVVQGDRALGVLNLVKSSRDRELAKQAIEGYELELIEVEPYPNTSQPIALSDYIVTLVIRKPAN